MAYTVRVVTSVPRARQQRTPQPEPAITPTIPNVSVSYHYGRELSETIGRIPVIGIDRGAMNGEQPGDGLH